MSQDKEDEIAKLKLEIEKQRISSRYNLAITFLGTFLVAVIGSYLTFAENTEKNQQDFDGGHREFVAKFVEIAIDDRIERRQRLARYFASVTLDDSQKERWESYATHVESLIENNPKEIAKLTSQIQEASEVERARLEARIRFLEQQLQSTETDQLQNDADSTPERISGFDHRIASWNVANLHHEDNTELRPGIGTARQPEDFRILQGYASKVDADIVSLQEMGSKAAAERLFPPDEYDVYMSSRYDVGNDNPADLYTAIAIRKGVGIEVIKQEDLKELSIESDTGITRVGTGLLLNINGIQIWVLSVHLKSSCASVEAIDVSQRSGCITLFAQGSVLRNWIRDRVEAEENFIIAGDFNRRFAQFGAADPLWALLNDEQPRPLLVRHPERVTRKCPTRKGQSTQPIDWIMVSESIADKVRRGSFWETRYLTQDVKRAGGPRSQKLSDHCPIHIDLTFD